MLIHTSAGFIISWIRPIYICKHNLQAAIYKEDGVLIDIIATRNEVWFHYIIQTLIKVYLKSQCQILYFMDYLFNRYFGKLFRYELRRVVMVINCDYIGSA